MFWEILGLRKAERQLIVSPGAVLEGQEVDDQARMGSMGPFAVELASIVADLALIIAVLGVGKKQQAAHHSLEVTA